jgi:hypothetical protein
MKNKILVLISLTIFGLSILNAGELEDYVKSTVTEEQIEQNNEIYESLTEEDKVMLMRIMYKEMKKRENNSLKEKESLVKALTDISKISTKNILKNRSFKIKLPFFSYNENKTIESMSNPNILRLISDKSYTINFDKKEIFETGSIKKYFEGMSKRYVNNNIIALRLDSMRNMFIISKPVESSHLMIAIESDPIYISEEWITNKVRQTIPKFNKGE